MEIFSIYICSFGADGLRLDLEGKILAYDDNETFVIFDGDMGSKLLHSHDTVKLKTPYRCYNGEHFCIDLYLEDGKGRDISIGSVSFYFSYVHCFFNRRICSIIRGRHGFVALHYTIFSDALLAKLRFTLKHHLLERSK